MNPLLQYNDQEPLAVQIERAYMNGCSDIEICKLMRITFTRFKKVYEEDEQFKELVDVGRTMSQAYWMQVGRESLTTKNFNTSLWMFNMKNRFGWSEKSDVTNYDATPDNMDELRSKLQDLLPKVMTKLHPEKTQSELLHLVGTK